MVNSRVSCNNKTRLFGVSNRIIQKGKGRKNLFEGARVVIVECTMGKSASRGTGTDMSGKFQDGSLSVWAGTDDDDISEILDRCNDMGGKNEFLPCLDNVDDVDIIRTSFPDIWFHVGLPLSA